MINIFTTSFPYGNKETFLETEIYYLNDLIRIFALNTDKSEKRELPQNAIAFKKPRKRKIHTLVKYLIFSVTDKDFFSEILYMKKRKKISLYNIWTLLKFMVKSFENKDFILTRINEWDKNDVIYSYWLYEHAYTAILLKRDYPDIKIISRAHGFDIYEKNHRGNYIPLRHEILNRLDFVCPISQFGEVYLHTNYIFDYEKLIVFKLGTKRQAYNHTCSLNNKELHIVSCSWMVRIKRLDRIIDALDKIPENVLIKWTHIGSGELNMEIQSYAKEKLGYHKNIVCEFLGELSSNAIYNTYKKDSYHYLINTSASEGLPVSMMEANSFGIPIIGVDVGGVSEIVENGLNGFLIPNNNEMLSTLVDVLIKAYNLDEKTYEKLKVNSRRKWEENFNAEINYKKFSDFITQC